MIFILACGADQSIDLWTWEEEHAPTEYSYEDLQKPLGLISYKDSILVSDERLQSIVQLQDDEQTIVTETLASPSELLIHNDDVYFTTESTIEQLFVEEKSATPLVENLVSPRRITIYSGLLFWIEEGALLYWDETQVTNICPDLSEPYDLITWNDALWITTQGDNGLWKMENDECSLTTTFDDIPHRMVASEELWITTRSFRWPYGGWIVSYDGDTTKHVESPPEPEHITIWNGRVIWSSKQSITSYEQIPYNMLAAQTTIGDMMIRDDILYWTDIHGGRIGSVNLAEP